MTLFARLFGRGERPAMRHMALDSRDAADVARLHQQGGFARGWSVTECEALLADRAIAADGGRARSGRIEVAALSRKAADEAEIIIVLVAPSLRGLGLGHALLAHHLAMLSHQGVRRVFLEVDEHNAPARALYARLGFREAGLRPGYYPMPDGSRANALILRHDIV